MFAANFFPARFFAPRYFPEVGSGSAPPPPILALRLHGLEEPVAFTLSASTE